MPVTRRTFLARTGQLAAVSAAGMMIDMPARAAATATTPRAAGWYAPADHLPHARTWMAWPARRDVWHSALDGVRDDIAKIARTIARFEPVSLIARPDQAADAGRRCGPDVEIVPIPNDDLWMRDVGPVFLVNGRGGLAGVSLNFNGWGGKQVHGHDAKVAAAVLDRLGLPRFDAPFVAEGGGLEFDGRGTAMATESAIVNPNRNPGKTRAQLTTEIGDYLGVDKVLWVPGVRGQDITDDHIDSLAVFVDSTTVAVDQPADPNADDVWARSEKQALAILSGSTNAPGQPLDCVISRESSTIPPGQDPDEFVNVYVNWYVCNGAVLVPAFGDAAADRAARELVGGLYPEREVVQLRIDMLASGGGGIHCATQQQPAAV